MKRPDPHSGPQSFEEEREAASPAPVSVTGLFSPNAIASAGAVDSNHEVSQLLQGPGAMVSDETSAAQAPPRPRPVVEEKSDAQPAGRGAADGAGPAPQVDITGVSRKVQLERATDESSRAEVVSSGENSVRRKEDVPHASSSSSSPEEGFTQMFQSLSAASRGASSKTPAAGPEKAAEGGAAPEEEHEPPLKWKEEPLARSQFQPGLRPAQGESTALFQRLDRQEPVPGDIDDRLAPAPAQPRFAGGFTQLLRTLSAESGAEIPVLPTAPAPLLPQPSGGPGEFTRIISGSMLREARGRTETPAGAEAHQAHASGESVSPAPMVAMGSAAPVMPMAPAMGLTPQQLLSPPPQPMPTTPPVPQVAPAPLPQPQISPQAPAEGKMQKYMPLLLIANVFLMVLVVILVVFVLLHH
ncbi:MAG TPA: hypothetical protein VGM27_10090 [Acidobacteriaceae bacterium]